MPGGKLPINIAVSAVVLFYFLAGYVMYRKYSAIGEARKFYLDRILTLAPAYYLVAIASYFAVTQLGPSQAIRFFAHGFDASDVFYTFTLFPLKYSFGPFEYKSNIIPPAWSLAAEVHFYLLVPLLFRNRKIMIAVFILVAAFHLYALLHPSGPVNSDLFGYRYMPGILAIFLFGSLVAAGGGARRLADVYAVFCALLLAFGGSVVNLWQSPLTTELVIGLALCVPFLLTALSIPRSPIDTFLGKIAYPVFLSHSLCIYLVEKLLNGLALSRPVFFILSLGLTIALSAVIADMQLRFVDGMRRRLTSREDVAVRI